MGRKRRRSTSIDGRRISIGAVAAVTAGTTVAVLMRRRRRPQHGPKHDPRHDPHSYDAEGVARTAITVHKPREQVERFWREYAATIAWGDQPVRFADAPGDRGTEIHVELRSRLPAPLARLAGRVTEQVVEDDLRRLKQALETGIVVRSDGSPEGASTARLFKQRPARPLPDLAVAGAKGGS